MLCVWIMFVPWFLSSAARVRQFSSLLSKAVHEAADLGNALPGQPGDGRQQLDRAFMVPGLTGKLGEDADVGRDAANAVVQVHEDLFLFQAMPLFLLDALLILPDAFLVKLDLCLFRPLPVSDIEERRDDGRPCRRTR